MTGDESDKIRTESVIAHDLHNHSGRCLCRYARSSSAARTAATPSSSSSSSCGVSQLRLALLPNQIDIDIAIAFTEPHHPSPRSPVLPILCLLVYSQHINMADTMEGIEAIGPNTTSIQTADQLSEGKSSSSSSSPFLILILILISILVLLVHT